jgi:hypothetical protein
MDCQSDLVPFCENYIAALGDRVPAGEPYKGYDDECDLLSEMTYAHNDAVKLVAIQCWGKFAPITKAGFLVARAKDKLRDTRAPYRVYGDCLNGAKDLAQRFDRDAGKKSKDQRAALIGLLPFLTEPLDKEGRTSPVIYDASDAILATIKVTGAPEALLALIHNLGGPKLEAAVKAYAALGHDDVTLPLLKVYTAKYNDEAAKQLSDLTGESFGPDAAKWVAWYNKNAQSLFFDFKAGKFIIDAKAAAEARK